MQHNFILCYWWFATSVVSNCVANRPNNMNNSHPRSSISRNPSKMLAPCDFPVPFTREFRECVDYLGISYICDPHGLFSRTEAEELESSLRRNYTDCFCHSMNENSNGDLKCRHQLGNYLNIGIGLINVAVGDCAQLSQDVCGKQRNFASAGGELSREFYSNLGFLFSDSLRNLWAHDYCTTDVFLLYVKTWRLANGSDLQVNSVYMSLSPRAIDKLQVSKRIDLWNLLQPSSDITLAGLPVLDYFKPYIDQLTKPVPDKIIEGVPTWALIVIISCSVLTILLAVVGHCVSSGHFKYFKSKAFNPSAARKWQAGFAGGMWEASAA